MVRQIWLVAAAVGVLVGCQGQEDIPKLSESQNQLPPADSPLGKRVREGMSKRGQPEQTAPSGKQ